MKSTLLTLSAALLLGPGCIVTTDRVVAGDPLDAHLVLTWSVEEAGTGDRVDCAFAGADTVRVTSRNIDTGDVAIDLFDCDATSGTTGDLDAGNHLVHVDLMRCGTSPTCSRGAVVSSAKAIGPFGVWDDDDYDLGHFVFVVD